MIAQDAAGLPAARGRLRRCSCSASPPCRVPAAADPASPPRLIPRPRRVPPDRPPLPAYDDRVSDWDRPPAREKEGGRVVLLLLLGLVLLLGGAYTAAYLAADDKVPPRHHDLRRRRRRAHPGRGRPGAPGRPGRACDAPPSTWTVDGRQTAFDPRRRRVSGSTTPPPSRRPAVRAAGSRPGCGTTTPAATTSTPVVTVDDAAMTSALERALGAGTARRPGTAPSASPRPGDGRPPRVVGSRSTSRRRAPRSRRRTCTRTRTAELTAGADRSPTSTPTTCSGRSTSSRTRRCRARSRWCSAGPRCTWQPREFASALRMRPEDGALVPDLDETRLHRAGRRRDQRQRRSRRRDRELVDGRPRVIPAKPGVTYDPEPSSAASSWTLVDPSRGQAPDAGPGHRRRAGVHDRRGPQAEDQGAGVDVHDVLPVRRVPQHQHRTCRRAGRTARC